MYKKTLTFLAVLLCLFLASCLNMKQESMIRPLPSSSPIVGAAATLPADTPSPPTPVISNQRVTLTPTRTPTSSRKPGLFEQTNIARLTEWAGNNTAVAEIAKRPSFTPAPPGPTPTPFVDDYPHKQVWLSYDYSTRDQFGYETFLGGYINFPAFVLYTDGQIILFHDNQPVQTKILSPDEICSLFITLESMGLSKIQTNGTGSPDDPIYQSSTKLERVSDDAATMLYINGSTPRQYVVEDHNKAYAVKAILNIFAFLNQFKPKGLQPYHADRLLVFVSSGQEVYSQLYGDAQTVKPLPWPSIVTPLSQNNQGSLYLEGEAASKVFDLTGGFGFGKGLFIDQGVEYTVLDKMMRPDEWRGRDNFSEYKAPEPFTPSFSCKYDVFK